MGRQVTRQLRALGVDATALSDALWPESTRSLKSRLSTKKSVSGAVNALRGQNRTKAVAEMKTKVSAASLEDGGDADTSTIDALTMDRRMTLNSGMSSGAGRFIVTEQQVTRGLHLDAVDTVILLGRPTNPDTYLHLAGRTGRWPRVEGRVVTI